MKVASAELRGLVGIYGVGITSLRVPLMCLIDYMGFRLIAMTLLVTTSYPHQLILISQLLKKPIKGEESLAYGSSNGGLTYALIVRCARTDIRNRIHNEDPTLNNLMYLVGQQLFLREHMAGVKTPMKMTLPVDIEGHIGKVTMCLEGLPHLYAPG